MAFCGDCGKKEPDCECKKEQQQKPAEPSTPAKSTPSADMVICPGLAVKLGEDRGIVTEPFAGTEDLLKGCWWVELDSGGAKLRNPSEITVLDNEDNQRLLREYEAKKKQAAAQPPKARIQTQTAAAKPAGKPAPSTPPPRTQPPFKGAAPLRVTTQGTQVARPQPVGVRQQHTQVQMGRPAGVSGRPVIAIPSRVQPYPVHAPNASVRVAVPHTSATGVGRGVVAIPQPGRNVAVPPPAKPPVKQPVPTPVHKVAVPAVRTTIAPATGVSHVPYQSGISRIPLGVSPGASRGRGGLPMYNVSRGGAAPAPRGGMVSVSAPYAAARGGAAPSAVPARIAIPRPVSVRGR